MHRTVLGKQITEQYLFTPSGRHPGFRLSMFLFLLL
jgi:hypothetical protein